MENQETTLCYLHKCKCMDCSLHFIVCSFVENWPEANTPVYCPECGSTGQKLRWIEESDKFIFEHVPGQSRSQGVSKEQHAKVIEMVRKAEALEAIDTAVKETHP